MKKKDNYNAIKEMRRMLGDTKKLVLENFIMPDEDVPYDETEEDVPNRAEDEARQEDLSNIDKELIQIRKIALSVINRLADQPTSESYDTMKRIWTLVDRAIDSKKTNEVE